MNAAQFSGETDRAVCFAIPLFQNKNASSDHNDAPEALQVVYCQDTIIPTLFQIDYPCGPAAQYVSNAAVSMRATSSGSLISMSDR